MILIKERVGKLTEEVGKLVYSAHYPIESYRMIKADERFPEEASVSSADWKRIGPDEIWGGHREFFYFETQITVPQECAGKTLVYELRTGREGEWDALNPQFLAYVNGKIKQGMDVNHRELLLTENARPGELFTIRLSAFTGDNNFSLHLDSEYKVLEKEVEKYYYDLSVPYETARLLNPDSDAFITIIRCLNESLNRIDLRVPFSEAFWKTLRDAQNYLDQEFYAKYCGHSAHKICCIGHTHIDVAWLWTLKTTEDKAVRSFATVLELMRRYPEYKFMSSQPQLYKYVKKNAPAVYEEVKKRVAEGRWEPEGGMFVEADCNIASGESLVRQFLYGTRFFRQEFGKRNEILWLPDVFGYSAALPQIMKKCGIRYFMTTKISWNEFDKMPYDTFMWEGIDGTRILTHFIPSRDYGKPAVEGGTETEHFTTYNAMLNPSMVKGSWQRYSQKDLNNSVLMSFGYGDGGGGPTGEMLENQRRLQLGLPGCPETEISFAADFFHQLEKDVSGNKYLPAWVGELYLEYHRGTYTSMARNKRFNRKAEFAFENLEFYLTMAEQQSGLLYPKETLQSAWEVILKNQFHDILPGSAIQEVYEDSAKEYASLFAVQQRLERQALTVLSDAAAGRRGDVAVFNPNGTAGKAPVVIPEAKLRECAGLQPEAVKYALTNGEKEYPLQKTEEGLLAVVEDIPAKGFSCFRVCALSDDHGSLQTENAVKLTERTADTPFFHVELDEKGHFSSIYDKKCHREIIPDGQRANVIISYEDKPHNFDAWDINNYYTEKSWPADALTSVRVIENGPVRGCIRLERSYLSSVIVQYIYFYRDMYQIDIRNEIDWKEKQILLRDYFPVDVHTNEAVYEIQYGNVRRPAHYNTSWDFAKFEVCAHKWLDVSEGGYGVSILNDCKYGCSVHDGVIGLSMLKSAVYPNPAADKEHHTFSYAICPHEGDFRTGHIVEKAYLFNNPYRAAVKEKDGGRLPARESFVHADQENIVIEVVKKQEDGEAVVIRMYECHNRRTSVKLEFAMEISEAYTADMLENRQDRLKTESRSILMEMKPYEIATILVKLK